MGSTSLLAAVAFFVGKDVALALLAAALVTVGVRAATAGALTAAGVADGSTWRAAEALVLVATVADVALDVGVPAALAVAAIAVAGMVARIEGVVEGAGALSEEAVPAMAGDTGLMPAASGEWTETGTLDAVAKAAALGAVAPMALVALAADVAATGVAAAGTTAAATTRPDVLAPAGSTLTAAVGIASAALGMGQSISTLSTACPSFATPRMDIVLGCRTRDAETAAAAGAAEGALQ